MAQIREIDSLEMTEAGNITHFMGGCRLLA